MMKITWFGHSCFKLDYGAQVILIDPFLTGNPTFEASGLGLDEVIKGVTHVALTHGHDDHVGDTVQICKTTGAPLVAVFELAMYLNGKGVERVEPANTGGKVSYGKLEISFVNALHSSGTFEEGQAVYLGNPCGLIFAMPGEKTVYHMGDTEIFSDMALIEEIHTPEIALVPIGDRFTMGAKTAALACQKYFKFQTVIPCHYGTFPMLDQYPEDFISRMDGIGVVVPKIGQENEF